MPNMNPLVQRKERRDRVLVKSVYRKLISYFSSKTYVVGTQKKGLNVKSDRLENIDNFIDS